jgi:hypothetical protein
MSFLNMDWLRPYALTFWELVRTPFLHEELIWGIVPLYFGWLVNELTTSKASFSTAVQTGFSFIWAAAHWVYQTSTERSILSLKANLSSLYAVNIVFTVVVLIIGTISLISGLRRKYPRHCSFLGHTRFSNYFMIMIFPIQANYLFWSWERFTTIVIFAIPIWLFMHAALFFLPRGRK